MELRWKSLNSFLRESVRLKYSMFGPCSTLNKLATALRLLPTWGYALTCTIFGKRNKNIVLNILFQKMEILFRRNYHGYKKRTPVWPRKLKS